MYTYLSAPSKIKLRPTCTYVQAQVAASVLDHSVDVRFQTAVFSHEFVVRIERSGSFLKRSRTCVYCKIHTLKN